MAAIGQTRTEVRVTAVIGGALGLLVRRPFSVLAWGLFTTVFAVAPISFILLVLLPRTEGAAQAAALAGHSTPAIALVIKLVAAYALAGLLALVTLAVVDTAVYRAVLEPESRGLFYLRMRKRELALVRVHLIQAVLWAVVLAVAALPLAWLIGATTNALGRSWAVLIGLVIALAAAFVFFIVGLRLSLSGPSAFAHGRETLTRSWRMTRGRLAPIVVTAVVMAILLSLGAYAMQAALHLSPFGAAAALTRGGDLAPLAIVVGVLVVYLGVARVLVAAPAALIYRQLDPSPEPGAETTPKQGARL